MYRIYLIFLLPAFWFIAGCHTGNDIPVVGTPAFTKEQQLQQNINTLKAIAQPGDLLVRLADDIISQQVTGMNEQERLYSHSGLVVQRAGQLYVYHIAPGLPGADTIQTEPLDSFINPQLNIRCALFRYQLSGAERSRLIQNIENYKRKAVRFDAVYDLATNEKLYCSEMIAKALTDATDRRMQFKTIRAPERMQKLLFMFFKKQHLSKEVIATRTFIPLDALYLRPDCTELMRFNLKIFPGQ